MILQLGYRGNLEEVVPLAEQLVSAGLDSQAAKRKAILFSGAARRLPVAGPFLAFYVPGRIEVLGKHTDYAGGRSMLAAAELGFCLVASARKDRHVLVCDAATGETVGFNLERELQPVLGHWSNYPMTVARRIARNFPEAQCGADIAFSSNLPPAAGMSSSSALVVAVFLALAAINRVYDARAFQENVASLIDLAGYAATVENGESFGSLQGDRGVGTFGGSEDHTAILLAQPGKLVQYAYCPVRPEQVLPLPAECLFCIGQSGVVAEKTGEAREKYNAASRAARRIVELWRRATGRDDATLADALASSPDAAGRLGEVIRSSASGTQEVEMLLRRLEHFYVENEAIVPAAADALRQGDLETFGRLVDQSQQAAEELLGNQVPETVFLARSARSHGAAAASAFGAGFGGSVWALVEAGQAEAFLKRWQAEYLAAFPQHAEVAQFFLTHPGPAAFQVC